MIHYYLSNKIFKNRLRTITFYRLMALEKKPACTWDKQKCFQGYFLKGNFMSFSPEGSQQVTVQP